MTVFVQVGVADHLKVLLPVLRRSSGQFSRAETGEISKYLNI
jgi:hypothetical protein